MLNEYLDKFENATLTGKWNGENDQTFEKRLSVFEVQVADTINKHTKMIEELKNDNEVLRLKCQVLDDMVQSVRDRCDRDDHLSHADTSDDDASQACEVEEEYCPWYDCIPNCGWVSQILTDQATNIDDTCSKHQQGITHVTMSEEEDGRRVHITFNVKGDNDYDIEELRKELVNAIVPASRALWKKHRFRTGPKALSIEVLRDS